MLSSLFRAYRSTWSVLVFGCLGIATGIWFPDVAHFFQPFGQLFISLISMVVLPMIFVAVFHSVANLANVGKIFSFWGYTILVFGLLVFSCTILGVVVGILFKPGIEISDIDFVSLGLFQVNNNYQVPKLGVWDFILGVIPTNLFQSFLDFAVLPILFFALLLGISIVYIKNDKKGIVIDFFEVINDMLIFIISKIAYLIPIAIFSLFAVFIGELGIGVLFLFIKFLLVAFLALFIGLYGIIGLAVKLFSNVGYFQFFKAMVTTQVVALGTSSSLISIQSNMVSCDKMSIQKSVSRFVLPLGATIHMCAPAIYYPLFTIFLMQLFGIDISFGVILAIVIVTMLSSMATPGVPGSSSSIVIVMSVAGVPLLALPIHFVLDRVLDMFMTAVNVSGDAAAAAIVNTQIGNFEENNNDT